jgi:RHS repeat-associated protein
VSAANQFTGGVPVVPGTNVFTIRATDPSGNAAMATYEVDVSDAPKTFTYDANGNLTADGTRTSAWDARNQLVAVTVGTHRSEFTYDGWQRRVRIVETKATVVQSDTNVVWCGRDACEERIVGAETSEYYADGFRRGTQSFFSTRDRLGSVHEVTDASAAVASRVDYAPFGVGTTLVGSAPARGFTGYVSHPPSGLNLATYRAYDSERGRWLSQDPLGDADGPNRYVYVRNNPVGLIDLYGLQATSCIGPEKPPCRPYFHKDIFFSCFLAQVTDPQVLAELTGCVGAGALFGPAAAGACGGLVGWYTSRQRRTCATFCDERGPKPCPPGNGPSLGPPPPPGPPPPGPSPNRR